MGVISSSADEASAFPAAGADEAARLGSGVASFAFCLSISRSALVLLRRDGVFVWSMPSAPGMLRMQATILSDTQQHLVVEGVNQHKHDSA